MALAFIGKTKFFGIFDISFRSCPPPKVSARKPGRGQNPDIEPHIHGGQQKDSRARITACQGHGSNATAPPEGLGFKSHQGGLAKCEAGADGGCSRRGIEPGH